MRSDPHPTRGHRLPLALAGLAALAVAAGLALRAGVAFGATHAALGDPLDGGFTTGHGLSPTIALIVVLALAAAGLVSATAWYLSHGRRAAARVTVRDARGARDPRA